MSREKHFVSLKLDGQSGVRTRDLWLYKQTVLTRALALSGVYRIIVLSFNPLDARLLEYHISRLLIVSDFTVLMVRVSHIPYIIHALSHHLSYALTLRRPEYHVSRVLTLWGLDYPILIFWWLEYHMAHVLTLWGLDYLKISMLTFWWLEYQLSYVLTFWWLYLNMSHALTLWGNLRLPS